MLLRRAALCFFALAACTGPTGDKGPPGDPGNPGDPGDPAPTTGTIAGVVTDGARGDPLSDVAIGVTATDGSVLGSATTDAGGRYSVAAPFGTVAVTFTKPYFTAPGNLLVGVIAGRTVTANAALSETASGRPSVVLAGATDVGYGALTDVAASAADPNGDTLGFTWSNATVPVLGTVAGNGTTATVTLPSLAEAFATRTEPGGPNQYVTGYAIDDRFGMLPITPDTRGQMSVRVDVSDGRGQSTSATIGIAAASVLLGVPNVAINTRVYLNSGHADGNAWVLTTRPLHSTAAFDDSAARTPSFVADKPGVYLVNEANKQLAIYAGDWQGAIAAASGSEVVPDDNCTVCHSATSIAPDLFTPWKATGHATMFARAVNGLVSPSYGAACFGCHTIGFDAGVANGGFDDVMRDVGWTMPTAEGAGWEAMFEAVPELARLGNIQCESCHGPQASSAHVRTSGQPWTSPRIGYTAELCATCHASGTGHHIYSEWATVGEDGVGHANRTAARVDGTRGGALNNHCGRCHTAQGYGEYATQLAAGNPGNLAATAGVSSDNVEPVTCVACHDPHDATNPNQLRFYGDTPLLPAGFQGLGAGKGALCITCHNSRNGTYVVSGKTYTYLHEDGELYNGGNPTGYSAPHQAAQGDVFSGRNAYFLGAMTPMVSRHAAIEDACVGCHMARNPETHVAHGSPATSGHVFRITEANRAQLCAGCHGPGVTGEGTIANVEALLGNVARKLTDSVKSRMTATGTVTVVAWDAASDLYSASAGMRIDLAQNPVTAVAIEEIHGQIGFLVTFASPIAVQLVDAAGNPAGPPKDMRSFGIQMGSIKNAPASGPPTPLYALSGNAVRAGWNYFLIEGDGSFGLHNPTFAITVLEATLAKDLSF